MTSKSETKEILTQGVDGGIAWKIDSDGTLTISPAIPPEEEDEEFICGEMYGEMRDYIFWGDDDDPFICEEPPAPWMASEVPLTKLIIENGVTKIGNHAFSGGCCGFTGTLTIPASVTTIGDSAFQGCCGFTGPLTIPASVTTIGDHAFHGCRGFTGPLTIPESVTRIGDAAFMWCYGFTGPLTIPESVTRIGAAAFQWCCGFTGPLTIPASVTTIGSRAFKGCTGLSGQLTLPPNVTIIGDEAFWKCLGLRGSIIIPANVTKIGTGAFSGCSITEISVVSENTHFCSINDVLYNSDKTTLIACPTCKSGLFSDLNIPSCVRLIEDSAFFDCSGLYGPLTLPENVTEIRHSAFKHCSGFTGTLTIPESVKIGTNAFAGCYNLDLK